MEFKGSGAFIEVMPGLCFDDIERCVTMLA